MANFGHVEYNRVPYAGLVATTLSATDRTNYGMTRTLDGFVW
jgi:hypothetical protein